MRGPAAAVLVLTLMLAMLTGAMAAEGPPPPPYRVIVHPRNPITSVDQKFVEDAFLKKITRWPNDAVIRPADLRASSRVRQKFSKEVLKRSTSAVKSYWQQRIFSGRGVPPPEFDDEERVVEYVLKHDGAIGYVSGTSDLKGSKAIAIHD